MNPTFQGLLLTAAAYLCGAVPFGFIVARAVRGIDIRTHGSGNVGATNVGRVLGTKWGIFVLLLDLLKGLIPVLIVRTALGEEAASLHWQVAAGVATVAGHMYPIWLGFRGGKGVATALGVVLCLAPQASLAAAMVFAAVFGIRRIVSLASMLAAISFAVCEMVLLYPEPFSRNHWSLSAFSLLVPLWIIVRHRDNLRRLLRGEEKRFRAGGDGQSPENSDGNPNGAGN